MNEFIQKISQLAIVILVLAPSAGEAALLSNPQTPSFSDEDMTIVSNNAILAANIADRPWLVRHLLDLIEHPDRAQSVDRAMAVKGAAELRPFDHRVNPDLDQLERSSAEAAYDLSQILKQVGSSTPASK